MSPVLAVDIGGTKFAAAVVAPDGRVLAGATVPTPSSDQADEVAAALCQVMAEAVRDAGDVVVSAVGVGSAGPVDPVGGTVSPVNIPAWRGFDLVKTVERAMPGRPVLLAGDGHCMALGEHWQGGFAERYQGRGALLGMVVSTGVGGGLVIDGRVYSGPTGNAGHIGHIVVAVDGDECPCGGRGCVETISSGPAMVRWALAQGWTHPAPDGRRLAEDAHNQHPVAVAAFRRSADALAAGIISAAALIDLDDVVIGGGIAAAGDVLFTPLRYAIGVRAGLGFVRRVRVHSSTLGARAGLLGAAALALDAAPS